MEQLGAYHNVNRRQAMRSRKTAASAGFTLIEVIIAASVLVVGVLAMSGLVALAVESNGHSRLDSTAVMLTQSVVEQVNTGLSYTSYKGGASQPAEMADCGTHDSTNPWQIESTQGGLPLTNGKFNWSTDPTTAPGYYMYYAVCSGGSTTIYDVRWNIQTLSGTSDHTSIITVATRLKGGGVGPITFPIYMQVLVGPDPQPGS